MSKSNFKISIIIVNFNNAKFLTKSITSALNQSYKNKEVIVVDDNSNDNSLDVINKFKKQIKIVKNKKKTNEGSYNQINCYFKGFLKSKGEYLFFLDSDDYFKKNKIEIIMNEFKKIDSPEIIFDLPMWKFKKKLIYKKFIQKKKIDNSWPRFPPQSCISIKKNYLEELFKNVNIKKFETIWFDFRIASYTYFKKKNLFILNKYLTYYRQLDNSASKKYKKFSRSWWFRRKQAHDFIYYLQKKFKIKTIFSIDKIITHLFNVVIK